MSNNELRFLIKEKLNIQDTENQTYGCRANNPDLCKNCYVDGICAFINKDKICKKPSAKWKKYYNILKEKNNG